MSGTNRLAELRRSLLDYDTLRAQTPVPTTNTTTTTPDPNTQPQPPNARARSSLGRHSIGALFSLYHNRHNNNDDDDDSDTEDDNPRRPKISRPIVDQGDVTIPGSGAYIYNHPSRPRLDVDIPRSSFSDLWGQRYAPDTATAASVGDEEESFGVEVEVEADEEETRQEDDDNEMGAMYLSYVSSASTLAVSVSSSPSPAPSTPTPMPAPPPAAEDEDEDEEEEPQATPSPRQPSERWLRHPLRQNPPPTPRAPPPSPASRPPSPAHAFNLPLNLAGFMARCGVMMRMDVQGQERSLLVGSFGRLQGGEVPGDASDAGSDVGSGAGPHAGSGGVPGGGSGGDVVRSRGRRVKEQGLRGKGKRVLCGVFACRGKQKQRGREGAGASARGGQIEEEEEEEEEDEDVPARVVEQEMVQNDRRRVRESWVTVSRWLE